MDDVTDKMSGLTGKQPPTPRLSGVGPGVMIETSEGPQPAEWLRPGDLVLTRDHGYCPLLWVGRSAVLSPRLSSHATAPPVQIVAGTLGDGLPRRDLVLSPAHHVLLRSPQVELHFGTEEVLAPVRDIATEAESMTTPPIHTYCHLLLARHELLLAEGVWLESLFPDETALAQLGPEAREEIAARLGHVTLTTQKTARMVLLTGEATVLSPRSAVATRRIAA
ncbi:Hint domain-containing protein [Celeribacter sp. ULVN23_4]